MKITAIRSDRIYRDMMTALPDEKENIYRNRLMKPFEFKWACVGIPLTATQEGGYDVVSAAAMSGFYAPAQITEARRAEIEKISSEPFWASCEASIRDTLLGFEQHGIQLPKQEYVFTVVLSDPQSPMTVMAGDYCGDGGIPGYIIGSIVPNERSLRLLPVALAHETNHADVLVSLELIASVCIHEDFAAGEVAFIMQLGGLLEELTVARARAGIEKLVHLTPTTARRLRDGQETVIAAEEVQLDDILKVLPGETVPVDGVIVSGQTSINQAVMTGESLPVDKTVGDEVSSGTVNQFGAFEMRATKVGADSSIQRMIRLVQSADATRHGFLVREGDALERLAKVKRVGFDKTGTLTVGVPKVVDVISLHADFTKEQIYAYAAAAERNSEHPLGKAVVSCYRQLGNRPEKAAEPDIFQQETEAFEMIPGQGVKVCVAEKHLLAGNEKLLAAAGITIPQSVGQTLSAQLDKGRTLVHNCGSVFVIINSAFLLSWQWSADSTK